MENILTGGIYRNVEVRITGAKYKPPVPNEMFGQIKNFYADMEFKDKGNVIEFAVWTHAEFVRIHPFAEMIASLEEQRLDGYLGIAQ